MPFVRVSRDKRGNEHIYLVDIPSRQGRLPRPRVLYWFRTPPGVTLGRQPFDPEIRRLLESKYPDLRFDWDELSKLPAPPPDPEPWRERRRAERAAKDAAKAERAQLEAAESNAASRDDGRDDVPSPLPEAGPVEAAANAGEVASEGSLMPSPLVTPAQAQPVSTGRRRRRGRRRGHAPSPDAAQAGVPPAPREPESAE